MTENSSCISCSNKAEHFLDYTNMVIPMAWSGYYCTSCFVKKLRGMVEIWNKQNKKYCSECNGMLRDKRFDKCDECLGLIYNPKKQKGD